MSSTRLLTSMLVAAPLALTAAPRQSAVPARDSLTALDRYVAAPDPSFGWKVLRELPAEGASATLLEMTSQRWLTEQEVERPLWTHWVTVIRPVRVTSDVGLLFITGGSLERQPPARPPAWLVDMARATGTVVSELRLVPNQPVVFKDDPEKKPRVEDDMIAYTWDKYLRTGDEKWPARLPMTKSAVRAMDAVTAFARSPEGGGHTVARYVVSGASKRGWTTWTTAAVDARVVAIAPVVIDMLNVEPSFIHHWRAYGAWSEAVDDYVHHRIMDWMGTPQFRALMKIEEPYEYRDRLTLPKLLLNATGDQFFLPDSSQFYFDDLKGETHVRYVPNASHSLDKTDALETLHAFYAAIVKNAPRPEAKWTFEKDGSIKVVARQRPDRVLLWQATNPSARNFRLDVLGPAFTSTALEPRGPNTWIGRVQPPAAGWTAYFVEMTFPTGDKYPLKLTSGVRVTPETLPYAAPPIRKPGSIPARPPAGSASR
ncbi:MAG TPA: PhoPQ-activated pathogenicity-related family protein [Vicinamibacterales bacterium]|nr:PhoPQ-activated pathogenicity-related family protein [Vicinamibacterales bacterium]